MSLTEAQLIKNLNQVELENVSVTHAPFAPGGNTSGLTTLAFNYAKKLLDRLIASSRNDSPQTQQLTALRTALEPIPSSTSIRELGKYVPLVLNFERTQTAILLAMNAWFDGLGDAELENAEIQHLIKAIHFLLLNLADDAEINNEGPKKIGIITLIPAKNKRKFYGALLALIAECYLKLNQEDWSVWLYNEIKKYKAFLPSPFRTKLEKLAEEYGSELDEHERREEEKGGEATPSEDGEPAASPSSTATSRGEGQQASQGSSAPPSPGRAHTSTTHTQAVVATTETAVVEGEQKLDLPYDLPNTNKYTQELSDLDIRSPETSLEGLDQIAQHLTLAEREIDTHIRGNHAELARLAALTPINTVLVNANAAAKPLDFFWEYYLNHEKEFLELMKILPLGEAQKKQLEYDFNWKKEKAAWQGGWGVVYTAINAVRPFFATITLVDLADLTRDVALQYYRDTLCLVRGRPDPTVTAVPAMISSATTCLQAVNAELTRVKQSFTPLREVLQEKQQQTEQRERIIQALREFLKQKSSWAYRWSPGYKQCVDAVTAIIDKVDRKLVVDVVTSAPTCVRQSYLLAREGIFSGLAGGETKIRPLAAVLDVLPPEPEKKSFFSFGRKQRA